MGLFLSLILAAGMQDRPPLAGSLPPMPASPSDKADGPRRRGPLFISPMGEPFRGPDPVRLWFDGADADKDGSLSLAEFVADADRFFVLLDRGKDGEIDPDDIDYYETVLAPEIRTGGAGEMGGGTARGGGRRPEGGGRGGGRRGGGGGPPPGGGFGGDGGASPSAQRYGDVRRGAARFSFFDYPEPVMVADTNFNRGVDPKEFRAAAIARFQQLDKNNDGKLAWGELPRLAMPPMGQFGSKGARGKPPGDGGGGPPPEEDAP